MKNKALGPSLSTGFLFLFVVASSAFAAQASDCAGATGECFLCGGVGGIPCSIDCPGHYVEGVGQVACACPQGKPCECYCPYTGGTTGDGDGGVSADDQCKQAHGADAFYDPSTDGCRCAEGFGMKSGRCVPITRQCTHICEKGETQRPYPDCSCIPQDKCKGVECDDKCEGGVAYREGVCNPDSGMCEYTETPCPQGCSDDKLNCKGGAKGRIFFTDYSAGASSGTVVPVEGIRIVFDYYDKDRRLHTDPEKYFTYSDANGNWEFQSDEVFAVGNEIDVRIFYTNKDRKLTLVAEDNPSAIWDVDYDIGLKWNDPVFQDMEMDLNADTLPYNMEAAKIYAYVLKAIQYKENVLGMSSSVTEMVHLYASGSTRHRREIYGSPSGIFITSSRMDFFNYGAPTNREFHEYCHHIHGEAQYEAFNRPGEDHAGYTNPDSQWGLAEGWAEFCALEMKRQYGILAPDNYEIFDTMVVPELNYKVTSASPAISEELAVAGILLDLRDSNAYYDYGVDDDMVSIPMSTIIDAMSNRYDFGDGKGLHYVHTVRDLYLALKKEGASNQALMSKFTQGSDRTNLDQIFIMHGAYQDANDNGEWDEGEEAGYSGKGSDLRSSLESEKGMWLYIDATDQNGNLIRDGLVARISVDFEAPNERYSYSADVPVKDGKVAIMPPPEDYPATITVTAMQGGTTNSAAKSLTVTTQEFYQKYDQDKEFGTYRASLSMNPVQCSSNSQCGSKNAGNVCVEGFCKTVDIPPPPGAGGGACSSATILLGAVLGLSSVFRQR